jgi:pimeloyl-ACP methyl ester carboxylesterase
VRVALGCIAWRRRAGAGSGPEGRSRFSTAARFTDFAAQGRQTGARWHGPPLRELNKPVLVMCGDADPMLRPRASRDAAAAIPGARLVSLLNVGHALPPAIWPTIAQQICAHADDRASA